MPGRIFFWIPTPLLALFILSIAGVAIWAGIDAIRKRRAITRMRCARCGAAMDRRSLELADAIGGPPARPGYRVRWIRTVFAICIHCGARYDWRGRDGSFRLVPEE